MQPPDISKTISDIYLEGERAVPYPLFMRCFNQLLVKPPAVTARRPSKDLKEPFRLLCMAANVGIQDATSRGEDRIREFNESILPLWKQELPPEEFSKFEKILDGTLREEQKRKVKPLSRAQKAEAALDKALQDMDGGSAPAPTEQEKPMQESDSDSTEPAEEVPGAGAFPSLTELLKRLEAGKIPIYYNPKRKREIFAAFSRHGTRVDIGLVKTRGTHWLMLNFPRAQREDQEFLDSLCEHMEAQGYRNRDGFTFQKEKDQFLLRASLGKNRIVLALRHPSPLPPEPLCKALKNLCAELDGIVENVHDS